jgi:hypothetical protein
VNNTEAFPTSAVVFCSDPFEKLPELVKRCGRYRLMTEHIAFMNHQTEEW